MTQEYIVEKRVPRSLTRRRSIHNGEKILSCSYFDLSRIPLNCSEEEYNRRLAEIKKMANVP